MTPPMEHNGDSTACESQRSIPTPFVSKTYQLVDDHNIDDVISWNDAGSSFIVWKPTVFATDLLPKYFRHNKFSSFVRQLNSYGFRKVAPDRWEFSNECFRRGKKLLLCEIQRGNILSASPPAPLNAAVTATVAVPILSPSNSGEEEQVISSNSSSSRARAELLEESERLRKENFKLNKELEEMRSLYRNIFNLILNHANIDGGSQGREDGYTEAETLHLMPMRRCSGEDEAAMVVEEMNPKRAREDDTVLRLHQPGHAKVKSEPLD
ncbi:heat stress transcription factor B-2b-like [Gastrolobium bilobum]|uniref:heat stress transcription factor B-2b-like n=1 Tax=Gastrolobium bilobum TaxID=150636 RepID=UPI002AAFFD19|nr:heat stress transcription factor B-2b-like [Gastrolobium bilobum]